MQISIDKNKCIGCFACKQCCYSVFEVGSDGKAKVRYGISDGDIEDAKSAAVNCPTGAISIIDDWLGGTDEADDSFFGIVNSVLDWAESDTTDHW